MKLKGINPFEQHVEKGVVGVCAAALAGVLVWQLFLQKPRVEVGGQQVEPSEAFEPVAGEARRLLARVDNPQPELPELPQTALREPLRLGLDAGSAAPRTTVALGLAPRLRSGEGPRTAAVNEMFALPEVPALATVAAHGYRAAISPIEKLRNEQLAALLPAEQPFDKASVSIEGVFDGAAFRAALEADPDGAGPLSAIPAAWWRDATAGGLNVEIVGIEVERLTVRTGSGQTPDAASATITLPAPPGFTSTVEYWSQSVRSAGDVPVALNEVRRTGEAALRPPFYEIIAGPEWLPPSEAIAASAGAAAGDQRARQVRSLRAELAQVDQRLEEIDERLGSGRGREGGARGGQTGGRQTGGAGRTGGGATRGGTREGSRESSNLTEDQRATLERNRELREAERERIVERLRDLGETVEGEDDEGNDATQKVVRPWSEDSAVRLWTHDMTVEPGAEYRYRMRIVINNPLFGRALQESQQALAEQSLLRSGWSEWTPTVRIDRDREFFIVSATDRDQVSGRPKATAELFVFYYGYYRSIAATAEAGDMFTGRVTLPELRLADMEALQKELDEGRTPSLLAIKPAEPEATASTRSGEGERGTGGRDAGRQGDRGSERDTSRSTGGARRQAEPEEEEEELIMTRNVNRQLSASLDSLLLGVRAVPVTDPLTGVSTFRQEAVLRDQTQQLTILSTEAARESETFRRLDASVKAGQEAARAPEPAPQTNQQAPPQRRREEAPTRGGGGGGG